MTGGTVMVWVVGISIVGLPGAMVLCGVHSSPALALAACTTPQHFIAPVMLDAALPATAITWPGQGQVVP